MMRLFAVAAVALSLAIMPAGAAAPPAADPVEESFATYMAFQADVNAIGSSYAKPADVDAALDRIASYNADALTRGFVAYAALAAAQNPKFVEEARKILAAYGPETTIRGFAVSGQYAASLGGGADAKRSALAAAFFDGARLTTMGDSVKTTALGLQNAAWARTRVTGTRAARVDRMRRTFSTTKSVEPVAESPMRDGVTLLSWTGASPTAEPRPAPASLSSPQGQDVVMDTVMSVAALRAIGATKTMPRADLDALMTQPDLKGCFERARLQLIQCVSAGEFWHENVACIGEAGLQSRGQCLASLAIAN